MALGICRCSIRHDSVPVMKSEKPGWVKDSGRSKAMPSVIQKNMPPTRDVKRFVETPCGLLSSDYPQHCRTKGAEAEVEVERRSIDSHTRRHRANRS